MAYRKNRIYETDLDKPEKVCRKCLEIKPKNDFHNRTASPDGKALYCRPCESEKKRIHTYGLTNDELLSLLNEQDGKCSICFRDIVDSFVVDHNHDTGSNRGLLCSSCNLMIGMASDNPLIFMSAAKYIERWKNA